MMLQATQASRSTLPTCSLKNARARWPSPNPPGQRGGQIPEAEMKARAQAAIACVHARLGDVTEAYKVTKNIERDRWQLLALAAVARAQAAAGRKEAAKQTMAQFADTSSRLLSDP